MYSGKFRIKCNIERGYCPLNHANKATVIWEPYNHCPVFDVGRSYARLIKFQKRYFIETLENNETNSGHKHKAHMYSSCFQKHLYDECALSRFEVLMKHIHKCNEHHPYYATQYQDIFVQYREGFNFVTSKPSAEIRDLHLTILEGTPSLTPYIKADILDAFVIPQESPVHRKRKNLNSVANKIVLAPSIPTHKLTQKSFTRPSITLNGPNKSIYL